MKLKVISTTDPDLKNQVLHLENIDEMLYRCSNSQIEIIDTWYGVEAIKKYAALGATDFWELHLMFIKPNSSICFIDEVEVIK